MRKKFGEYILLYDDTIVMGFISHVLFHYIPADNKYIIYPIRESKSYSAYMPEEFWNQLETIE